MKQQSQNVIQASGLQDAYEYLLKQLCKKGLPTGNVYEFSAQTILKYEKKLKSQNIQQKAQIAAKEAHDKFVKKMQDKEERNLESISKYELAFREEMKRKEQNQSISQEPVQRSSVGKQAIVQNQSVEKVEQSPPKVQKKVPEASPEPKQQEPVNQQSANAKKQTKKETKKPVIEQSILKDLKLEEQKDQQKQEQQKDPPPKEPKEQQKEQIKEQPKEQPKKASKKK